MKAPECGLRSADVSVCPLQRARGRLSEQPACLQPRHSQSVHSDTLGVPSMNVVNNLIIRGCALSTIETHGRLCGEIHDGGGGKGVSLEPEANMQSEFLVHLLILTQEVIKRGFCSAAKGISVLYLLNDLPARLFQPSSGPAKFRVFHVRFSSMVTSSP